MECVIFVGIQASGKSTFYKEKFFNTHMRINLDMLKTRHRENIYLAAGFQAKQPFVVDNTNATIEHRKKYIELAKQQKFKIIGYYFEPDYAQSIKRNNARTGKEKVPVVGISSVMKKLQAPNWNEGFDELYRVTSENGQFYVERMGE
ncbi:ATP-binding protein [Paenibacillus xerothermodurans]|uniref:ATP-binding protein n=1 Tax=Paenibacillus xerothermodurans TaxID=1977292 RepID=A0A2W1NUB1_PAEXE|nr:ATP-binding protein [Paenibacillus xerothermodurans]PZE21336.1 ATP-binding protein [Paenibacillus xerothermodurans]